MCADEGFLAAFLLFQVCRGLEHGKHPMENILVDPQNSAVHCPGRRERYLGLQRLPRNSTPDSYRQFAVAGVLHSR